MNINELINKLIKARDASKAGSELQVCVFGGPVRQCILAPCDKEGVSVPIEYAVDIVIDLMD